MRSFFPFAILGLILLFAAPDSSGLAGEELFSRTRHRATLLALLCYNPLPQLSKNFSAQRAQELALCHTFTQEGGYDPKRAAAILEIRDPEVEHLALLLRELDGKAAELPRPGPLLLATTAALAYTLPSPDGLRAAEHLASLSSVTPDTPPVARAAYSMIVYAIEGKLEKKEELIEVAALNAADEQVAKELRALRLREWRKLPEENTPTGRLCRAVYLWQQARSWNDAMSLGRRQLRYPESMQFLAVICAGWEDLPRLPEELVWDGMQEREIRDLCAALHELARDGVLNPVPLSLIKPQLAAVGNCSEESVDGQPAVATQAGAGRIATAEGIPAENLPLPEIEPVADLPSLAPIAQKKNRPNAARTTDVGSAAPAVAQTTEAPAQAAPATPRLPVAPAIPTLPASPRQPGVPAEPAEIAQTNAAAERAAAAARGQWDAPATPQAPRTPRPYATPRAPDSPPPPAAPPAPEMPAAPAPPRDVITTVTTTHEVDPADLSGGALFPTE